MKKITAILLSVLMVFSVVSIAAVAEDVQTYEVTFTDLPYDVAPYRSDYVGKYMGYEYGVDYWFTITNDDGTTTDIKGWPYSITVFEGDSLEFTVSVADYVEPSSVRMLAFPTGTATEDLYDDVTGEPYAQYYIAKSVGNTYGVRPQEDMTVCLSEFHLFNDCFMYDFPTSDYYTAKRVQYNADGTEPWEVYTDFEWGNTKVVYVNETFFFEVRIPMNDNAHTYHYDTYQVTYTTGSGNNADTVYLKSADQTDYNLNDNIVAHYETYDEETGEPLEWVDVYKVDNIQPDAQIKVRGTVTYTMAMLKQFFNDFDVENMDDMDWESIDFSPMVEYIARILALIMKILRGFGLSISFG